jgi:AraC-like DNA-binding protein
VEASPGREGADAPIPKASIAPGLVPPEELPSLWRRSIAPFFDARPAAGPQAAGSPYIHQYLLETVLFADSEFPAQTFERDRGWMSRHDDTDHLLLQLFARGRNAVVNGSTEYVESADSVYAVNCAHPIDALSTESRVMSLVVPRALVMDELPHLADARGALFEPGSAAARIFIDHMLSLAANLPRATAAEAPGLVRGTLGLLDSLSLRGDVQSSQAGDAVFRAACRYIEARLGDPGLSVDGICRHLRCSRATLYRVFRSHGGVRQHIQRRRLVACFRAICSPRHRHRRIFDVALDFGFTSPSHFSHLFRSHFGMTPRDVREAGLHGSPAGAGPSPVHGESGDDVVERTLRWARTLARPPVP